MLPPYDAVDQNKRIKTELTQIVITRQGRLYSSGEEDVLFHGSTKIMWQKLEQIKNDQFFGTQIFLGMETLCITLKCIKRLYIL